VEEQTAKLEQAIKGDFYVFIDAANLEQSVKGMWVNSKDIPDELKSYKASELGWHVNYKQLKKFFKNFGELKQIHFFSPDFKTNNHTKFLSFLRNGLKFRITTKPLKEYQDHTPNKPHRKANFDVEISAIATYHIKDYKTFILFSGDSDFEYLLKFLRGRGKICIVFSRQGHVASELPPASNYYFDIVDFRKDFLTIKPKNAKNPA